MASLKKRRHGNGRRWQKKAGGKNQHISPAANLAKSRACGGVAQEKSHEQKQQVTQKGARRLAREKRRLEPGYVPQATLKVALNGHGKCPHCFFDGNDYQTKTEGTIRCLQCQKTIRLMK